jgi:hypothetical protein
MREKPQNEYLTHVVVNRGDQPVPVPGDVENDDGPATGDPDRIGARKCLATGRPPLLRAGVENARAVIGDELAPAMVTSIPAAIIGNKPVHVPPPARYQPRFR